LRKRPPRVIPSEAFFVFGLTHVERSVMKNKTIVVRTTGEPFRELAHRLVYCTDPEEQSRLKDEVVIHLLERIRQSRAKRSVASRGPSG
jgi:hypothetical protein